LDIAREFNKYLLGSMNLQLQGRGNATPLPGARRKK
jgi:hypothetical protein